MKTESRSGHCVPQAQAIRLERLAYGAMSYLVGLVLAAVICWLGYIELRVLLTYLSIIVALNLLYFALVRTNLNLRLADPNMTLVQICTAICAGILRHVLRAAGERALPAAGRIGCHVRPAPVPQARFHRHDGRHLHRLRHADRAAPP